MRCIRKKPQILRHDHVDQKKKNLDKLREESNSCTPSFQQGKRKKGKSSCHLSEESLEKNEI